MNFKPSTLKPKLRNLNPRPEILNSECSTLNPQISTLNPRPSTLDSHPPPLTPHPSPLTPQPSPLNPQPSTLNPQPSTLDPQPSTLNPKPESSTELLPGNAHPWGKWLQQLKGSGKRLKGSEWQAHGAPVGGGAACGDRARVFEQLGAGMAERPTCSSLYSSLLLSSLELSDTQHL